MANMNDNLASARHYRVAWTTTPADYNCVSNDPGKGILYGNANGRVAKAVIVGTPGALVVTDADGTNVTLPTMPEGFQFDFQVSALVASGSTAQNVIVVW